MSAATTTKLLTAEEFALLNDGQLSELVRGRVVPVNMPAFEHGRIAAQIVLELGLHLRQHPIGQVVSNDSGIVTERGPDTVRGADVAFYSHTRLPRGERPKGYPRVAPELVFEIRSPSDRWRDVLTKVSEYLQAGVQMVIVLDPDARTAHVFRPDEPVQVLRASDELAFPEWLAGWRVRVERLLG